MNSLAEPLLRFQTLLAQAQAFDRKLLPEPTAFSLATTDARGRPSVRIVLLKAADASGLVFYTNLQSRKGRELLGQPWAALCFHWQPMEQQVRIEGSASQVSDAEADAYFRSRPRGSQIGAWASLQSQVMAHPEDLPRRVEEIEQRFAGTDVLRPPRWSGFRIAPQRWEFWSGRPSRLHQRDICEQVDGRWVWSVYYP